MFVSRYVYDVGCYANAIKREKAAMVIGVGARNRLQLERTADVRGEWCSRAPNDALPLAPTVPRRAP